jgi:hypothetical protein
MGAKKRPAIITLLTDFGLQDHFVGAMKGVIAGLAPEARVIDITHEVQPYQIGQARFLIDQSWRYFPMGTVHVCVVDPGVGSARRPVALEAQGHFFVGPDNGLFSDLLDQPRVKVRQVSNRKLMLREVSNTFHGRDLFAPVAAHLAAGVPFSRVGPLVTDPVRITTGKHFRTGRKYWTGEVVHIDRFGNLITNLPYAEFERVSSGRFALRVGLVEITELSSNYASGEPGVPLLLVGSAGTLEVAMNQGSASKSLGVGLGAPVELELP